MSGPSTYEPKPGIESWLDKRLPIVRLIYDSFVDYPTPKNLNYFYTFGAMLTVCLVLQIATGIVLAMHYSPTVEGAFASVQRIKRDVPYGWLIQNIHAVGASMFFLVTYFHMFRGLYYGSYKAPREVLWILGVLIYLVMTATAFFGYVLPWGQMSFWGATVITNFFTAIPVVGNMLQQWLMGGFAIDNATLNRFFSLHYLLPFVIAGLVVLHIWALHVTGQNNPDGVEVKSKEDTVPFTPHATIKDLFAVSLFMLMFALFVFFLPDVLGDPENYNPADALKTPPEITPEWYLRPFYAMLRAVTFDIGPFSAKLLGLMVMAGSLLILIALPWLDTSKVKSMRYRPVARIFFLIFVLAGVGLGWCGGKGPDFVIYQAGEYQMVGGVLGQDGALTATTKQVTAHTAEEAERLYSVERDAARASGREITHHLLQAPWAFKVTELSQVLTLYYFAFFLLILPILGLRERPKRVPDSISGAIAAKAAAPDRKA